MFHRLLKLLFFFSVGLTSNRLTAQDFHWNLRLSAGAQYARLLDEPSGQLVYRGTGIVPAASLQHEIRNYHSSISLSGGRTLLRSEGSPSRNTRQTGAALDMSEVRFFGDPEETFRLGVGVGLNSIYNTRRFPDLINGGRHNDFAASLGPAVRAELNSSPAARGWIISTGIDGGLLSLFSSSSYPNDWNVIRPKKDANPFADLHLGGFNKLLRLIGQLSVSRQLSLAARAGLSYRWDFYRVQGNLATRQAAHQLSVYYQFYFP